MDLDSFATELYVLVDDWWRGAHGADPPRPGRPPRLSAGEVLTLALLAQWPRWRSERDFWRCARARLRPLFPALGSQSQLNRRVRSLAPELRALQAHLAAAVLDGAALYRVLDTSLVPAMRRVRACRHGLFAGQAAFGRSASHTEWVYGFKLGLAVAPPGVVTAFGLAPGNCPERPVADALVAADGFGTYLADKGIAGAAWGDSWRRAYGAEVVAAPPAQPPPGVDRRRGAVGRRQAPGHRTGPRPAQGPVRPGAPPRQDPRRPPRPPRRQDRRLHRRRVPQRPPRSALTPARRPPRLTDYASAV